MTTIQEIAAAAGVSPATVSRVLNGRTPVSADKAERVRRAVDRLGWRPDGPARNLRRGVTDVWAAIVPDIENPFLNALVRGVEDVAQANGYSIVLCNADDNLEKEARYISIAMAERMAGVIIAPTSYTGTDLSPLHEAGIPVVCVLRRHPDEHVDGVFVDDRLGARLATEHLIANGARRPACVTGPRDTSTATERLHGFKEAVTAAGLAYDESLVRYADFRYDGGLAAAKDLLAARRKPDAIFATNNVMGVAVLDACVEYGVTVPEELRVACFENVPWGRYLQPRLTFVGYPARSLGETAARLILERREDVRRQARHVVFSPALTVEASSTATRDRRRRFR